MKLIDKDFDQWPWGRIFFTDRGATNRNLMASRIVTQIKDAFEENHGQQPPDSWIETHIDPGDNDNFSIFVRVRPPRKGNEVWLIPTHTRRSSPVTFSDKSSIPLVLSPYSYDRSAVKQPNHHAEFVGWDMDSGLMAFDVIKEKNYVG